MGVQEKLKTHTPKCPPTAGLSETPESAGQAAEGTFLGLRCPRHRGAQQGDVLPHTPISGHLAGLPAPLRVAKSPVTFVVTTLRWPPAPLRCQTGLRGAQRLEKVATRCTGMVFCPQARLCAWSTVESAVTGTYATGDCSPQSSHPLGAGSHLPCPPRDRLRQHPSGRLVPDLATQQHLSGRFGSFEDSGRAYLVGKYVPNSESATSGGHTTFLWPVIMLLLLLSPFCTLASKLTPRSEMANVVATMLLHA